MKRTIISVSTIVIAFVVLCCSSAMGQDWDKDQLELWNEIEASWQKWSEGDAEGTLKSFHENYQGWSDSEPLPVNKERITKWFMGMKDALKVDYVDLNPARITITDKTAVVHYYFTFSIKYGEKEKTNKGKNTEFYVKEGGEWMLLGDFTYYEKDDDHD